MQIFWRAVGGLLVALLISSVGSPVAANTVVRTGESIEVGSDQLVDGDFYILGQTVSLSGTVTDDVVAIAGGITTNGSVGGDILAITGSFQHHATVTDDVRVIAGDVTIAESVGGDLVVVGGVLKVLSTATIAGDVLFFGGSAEVNGTVTGSVLGASERIRIDGPVGGTVDVTSGQVTLGDRAQITGDIRYISPSDLMRGQNAAVEGTIIKSIPTAPASEVSMQSTIVPFFVLVTTVLIMHLLFRSLLVRVVETIFARPLLSAVAGSAVIFAVPFVTLLLLATIIGLLVGLLLFTTTLVVYVLGTVAAAYVTAGLVSYAVQRSVDCSLWWLMCGTAVWYALFLVPVIGPAVALSVYLFALGGLLLTAAEWYRRTT